LLLEQLLNLPLNIIQLLLADLLNLLVLRLVLRFRVPPR
jgi:hypothetical protein